MKDSLIMKGVEENYHVASRSPKTLKILKLETLKP